MIDIDFSFAISFYLFLVFALVFAFWILSSRSRKEKDLSLDDKFIWFCSICTYTYVNTREDAISICPRCGSYNKKGLT